MTGNWWGPGAPETSREQPALALGKWASFSRLTALMRTTFGSGRAESSLLSLQTPSLIFPSPLSIFLPRLLPLYLLPTGFRLPKSLMGFSFHLLLVFSYDRRGRNTAVISRAGQRPGSFYPEHSTGIRTPEVDVHLLGWSRWMKTWTSAPLGVASCPPCWLRVDRERH